MMVSLHPKAKHIRRLSSFISFALHHRLPLHLYHHNYLQSMASTPPPPSSSRSFLPFLVLLSLMPLPALAQQQPLVLKYHHGPLLKGNVSVNLVWYGHFSPSQRSIVVDFLYSLVPQRLHLPSPSASSWWKTTEKYSPSPGGTAKQPLTTTLMVSAQLLRPNYPLGKSLKNYHLRALASKPAPRSSASITIVLTSEDVFVEGFCSRCGSHWSSGHRGPTFIWVGNSATQCPGQCAWPFHQPIYGPQVTPLVPPNGDVGVDGMIINIATLLAGTATNPFGNGYFQGSAEAPLEAVTACAGEFGSGSYPGYPGKVLVDTTTGGSYNANGVNGRKFLLPAMWDPQFSVCETLV
ncbi:hypothetical protein MLD38_026726 [Melastoma candidum]|uniref:Uncharacterized protein n=2 Tax=Melastoma candidum TaxID=119954 RepID=A0ACB9P0J6_9MYRT|nr:hypothetical protein MLD38_026726 [Melastoma candidum]